jgi:hypothetical protein
VIRHRHDYLAGVFRLSTWTHWGEREILALPLSRLIRYLKMTEDKP